MTRWLDEGVQLLVDISTSGTFISPPFRVAYPFTGTGVPVGWSLYIPTGGSSSDFTVSTSADNNTVTISRSGSSTRPTTDYGIQRAFSITPGHRYRVSCSVKGNPPSGPTSMPTLVADFSGGTRLIRSSRPWPDGMPDSFNWYTMSVDQDAGDNTTLTVVLQCRIPLSVPPDEFWSVLFSDVAITDVTTAAAPSLTWHNVECDTMSATIRYGRARFTERYDVGTFTMQLNNVSGEYIYQDDHPWGFRPGRLVRLRAVYKTVTYPMCFGVLDRIKTFMDPDGKATVTLTAFDTTSYTSDTPTPQISFAGSGINDLDSLSGNRVDSLLNIAGVAQSVRAIDPGIFGTQNVSESGRGLREEIGVTADSEGGSFFGERDGTIVYRDRSWSSRDPKGGTVQANFTAFPNDLNIGLQPDNIPTDPNAPVICPSSMDTDWSLERVINTITLATAGSTKRFYSNQPSQTDNGVRTYQRLDFVNLGGFGSQAYLLGGTLDTQLAARANDIFSTSLDAMLRVQRLEYRPQEGNWEWTLTAFLDWLVRVFYYIRDGTWGFATVVRVQSITHQITPHDWVVSLDIDQPISYTDNLVPLPPGGWDIADWDASVWDDEFYTNSAIWSAGFRWSNPESKWGE